MSPWRLPGEPNRASAVWLAAGDQTSLGGVSRLFSRSSLITTNTYTIQNGEMQEEKPLSRRISVGKGREIGLVLALVGVQRHARHAAEDAAHYEDPPGGAPGVPGEAQAHVDGSGQQHDDAADGADEV